MTCSTALAVGCKTGLDLHYQRDDIAEDAAALDAFITGPAFDALPRHVKIQALRRHSAMVWRLQDLDDRIASHNEACAKCQ